MTFVTFLCVLNMESAGISSFATMKPELVTANIYAMFLPEEFKVISGFNPKCCFCSSAYWLAHWV